MLIQMLLIKDLEARLAARDYAERGLAMARALDDQRLTGAALRLMASLAYLEYDLARVRELGEESVAIARRTGDNHQLGMALAALAFALSREDERRVRLEALACLREAGDHLLTVAALHNLYGVGLHAWLDEARAYLEEAITLAEELGADLMLYFLRGELSIVLLIEGRHAEAAPLVRRNLLAARRVGGGRGRRHGDLRRGLLCRVARPAPGRGPPARRRRRRHHGRAGRRLHRLVGARAEAAGGRAGPPPAADGRSGVR